MLWKMFVILSGNVIYKYNSLPMRKKGKRDCDGCRKDFTSKSFKTRNNSDHM